MALHSDNVVLPFGAGEAMTVPVLGSLLAMVVFGIVLPYRSGISVRKALWPWTVTPQYHFRLDFPKFGVRGISLKEPGESRYCASCGKDIADDSHKFFYEWLIGYDVEVLHPECLEEFSTLKGADMQTYKVMLRLSIEYGPLLQNDFPEMSNSLMEKAAYFRQLCMGESAETKGSSSLVKRPRFSLDAIPWPLCKAHGLWLCIWMLVAWPAFSYLSVRIGHFSARLRSSLHHGSISWCKFNDWSTGADMGFDSSRSKECQHVTVGCSLHEASITFSPMDRNNLLIFRWFMYLASSLTSVRPLFSSIACQCISWSANVFHKLNLASLDLWLFLVVEILALVCFTCGS